MSSRGTRGVGQHRSSFLYIFYTTLNHLERHYRNPSGGLWGRPVLLGTAVLARRVSVKANGKSLTDQFHPNIKYLRNLTTPDLTALLVNYSS